MGHPRRTFLRSQASHSGSLWADTVLGEEHSDTEGRLELDTVDMESTPLKQTG